MLAIYDMPSNQVKSSIVAHDDDINAVAYADDACTVFFTGSDDRFIKVWDTRCLDNNSTRRRSTTDAVGVLIGHTEGIASLDSKGDGRYIISNSKDQTVKLWDVRMMRGTSDALTERYAHDVPKFGGFDYRWQQYPAKGRLVTHPRNGMSLLMFYDVLLQNIFIESLGNSLLYCIVFFNYSNFISKTADFMD